VDDIGIPYLGKQRPKGMMEHELVSLGDAVRILGNCEASRLRDVYCAADAYISLSTHNDEDFGMAPAEAAACGLPLVLSNWAGLASFRALLPGHAIETVSVKMETSRVLPSLSEALAAMTRSIERRCGDTSRAETSRNAREALSISSASVRLEKILLADQEPRFSGFSGLLDELAAAFEDRPESPFLSGNEYSELYRKVYRSYV
jgi:glycosyltransferase involved in cell wall biosynthesis